MVLIACTSTAHAAPAPPPNPVKLAIREIFPHHYKAAQRVAYCESHYDRRATNGQYAGVFELSLAWRRYFRALHPRWRDVAYTPSENIRAAHAIFKAQGWRPWTCGWAAHDRSAPR
jgi:hypothetical protein